MMNDFNYRELLVTCDHKDHWEYPPSFDWECAFKKFDSFEEKLKEIIKVSFSQSRESIQDASFHGCIGVVNNTESGPSIRFSNFGNMVTILNPKNIKPERFQQILNMFIEFDYLYIPVSELDTQYNGKLTKFEGTWFNRFFDYL